jgi:DNA-binding transcriptional regulator of glucitol operon
MLFQEGFMQIQDLDYSQAVQHPVRGGFFVNTVILVATARSTSSAIAVAYFGDASARAISKNNIGISLD